MSDWINESADKVQAALNDKRFRETAVNLSNYWLALWQQLNHDVTRLNEHQAFRPLRLHCSIADLTGIFTIKAAMINASVSISVLNKGSEMELVIESYRFNHTEGARTEQLTVIESGKSIVLKRGYDAFVVPQQAAEFILSPVNEMVQDYLR